MEYIVQRQHIFRDELGRPLPRMPGQRVNVDRKRTARQLIEQGIIASETMPSRQKQPVMRPPSWRGLRVGLFTHTSTFYSGGRIHMHQMAWTMANDGAEVFIITDNRPIWACDYPDLETLFIVRPGERYTMPPDDLDLILTDGKGGPGLNAVEWKNKNPHVPLICMNFETPNWMEEFDKNIAKKMPQLNSVFANADVLLANSAESLKFLHEYMTITCQTGVVPPAANTCAVDMNAGLPLPPHCRNIPFVVWSARGSAYKGAHVIVRAIENYPKPLNLVMIGKPSAKPVDTDLHKFITFKDPINDAQKMRLMKEATCAAAPSLFEGFGMVPAEALCNGTPVVAYDLPVLRQEYGDRLIYAKWNSPEDFTQKLHATVEDPPKVDKVDARKVFGMPAMAERMRGVPFFNFKAKRISAHMICYYGATVHEAIESVYPHVDEVLIAYGPTQMWKHIEPDGALDVIKAFPDPENKIKLAEKDVWRNKGEMRKATQKMMTGNYMLIVDADEIYHGLDKWIEKAPDFGCPRWVHFWHDVDHYVVDTPGMDRWGDPHPLGGCVHNHFRWAYWRYSNYWWSDRGTAPRGADEGKLSLQHQTRAAIEACPETCIYHLGHVMDRKLMKAKHEFYLRRDGRDKGRVARMTSWHKWNGEENSGDGLIKKVDWQLPDIVRRAFEKTRRSADG